MKKFILSLIAVAFITCLSAQSTLPRYGTKKNEDNTGRVLNYGFLTPIPTATMNFAPNYYSTLVTVSSLTLSPTYSFVATNGYAADNLTIVTSATSQQTVTLAGAVTVTGAASTYTIGAGKTSIINFLFSGGKYIELDRAIQP